MTRLVIAAFDGLLPQQVTAELAPTISSLAESGVTFTRHHSVFPTVTRANSASMVTGCYPATHGIPANRAVFADHDPHSVMDVLQPELQALAAADNGQVLFVPTIGEILAKAGMTHVSVVGGTSGNAYVHFPRAEHAGLGGLIHPEFSLPADLGRQDAEKLGPWPGKGIDRVRRVGDSACRFVIPEINPDLLFVWFPEPDTSNHAFGIGSKQSNLGLAEADAALGRILETLRLQGDNPDVMVISDHGYSTITGSASPEHELVQAGFTINSGEGTVLVGNNGGALLLDYPAADDSEVEKLANWLHTQPWAGVVFSTLDAAIATGALPAKAGLIGGVRAPQFTVSMAWNDENAGNGFSGTAWNGSDSPVGAGMHGSASPYEIRNTLVAAGPSFKHSFASSVPSGNVDIAPTALRILGIEPPSHMDGRILAEAFDDGPETASLHVEKQEIAGADLKTPGIDARRYVAFRSTVNEHVYLDAAGVSV